LAAKLPDIGQGQETAREKRERPAGSGVSMRKYAVTKIGLESLTQGEIACRLAVQVNRLGPPGVESAPTVLRQELVAGIGARPSARSPTKAT
jgi:hypothetical protein